MDTKDEGTVARRGGGRRCKGAVVRVWVNCGTGVRIWIAGAVRFGMRRKEVSEPTS